MRQRWSLGVLYLLQLLVLSGLVATYIVNNKSYDTPPGAPPRLPQKSQTSSRYRDENIKPTIKMKPIPMAYVLDNIQHVKNPIEFYRMFTTPNASDDDISHMLELKCHSTEDDTTLRRNRRRKKGPEASSPSKNEGHDGGSGNNNKTASAGLGTRNGHSVEMDAETKKTFENFPNIARAEDMEFQNDAPATGNSNWSLKTEILQAALNHIHNYEVDAESFRCKEPKVFFHRLQHPMKVFMPDCIKLYRCMNFTGCCDRPAVCSPKKIQIVQRAFLILHLEPVISGSDLYLNADNVEGAFMTFENHTECECVVPKRQQSCPRACPTPFTLAVEQSQCTCVCRQPNPYELQECTFIQQGIRQLAEEGLECIKASQCYYPQCERGSFDVPTGLCPLAPEHALPSHQFQNPANHSDYRSHIPGFTQSEVGAKITHPFKVLSTTKSPQRIQNEKDVAVMLSRLNSHRSSAYHEGHRHQPLRKPKPKPNVETTTNSTSERAKLIAKMPNPGMSGSYHESYRPYRPIPKVTNKVNKSENLSSNSTQQNVTQTSKDFYELLTNISDSYPISTLRNESRLGISEEDLSVNNGSDNASRNTSIVLTTISSARLNESRHGIPEEELFPNNSSDIVKRKTSIQQEDTQQIGSATNRSVPTASERSSSLDMTSDQDDGSTDLVQQEGSSNGGGRGAPVDQVEDTGSVYDKSTEGSGQD